ncbi:MAG TPA: hypothetical protein PLJ60_10110 [Chryseolinea sp.]|nr:hypothetical protein [Chryseolinea sp.]HPH45841.1 hypothetical protein [Chryseolinea sp.]HPM30677.1 hypothetical protein [Chryseolinea sp.]
MKTKTKRVNKKMSNAFTRSPNSNRKSKSIDNPDLNEDDQQQIRNHQRDEYLDEARVDDSDFDSNRVDKITNDVEEQEDREVLRKKDEAQGNEQV